MQMLHRPRWVALVLLLLMALPALAADSARAESDARLTPGWAREQQETTVIDPVPRPAYLYAGTCDAPGAIQWPLNSLVSPGGEPGGAEDRDRTEYSFTGNVPLGIDLTLSGEYMIAVHESGENPDRVLVCGNIGGVADSAGTLVVGLRQASEVKAAGVAVLSPSPANPTMTLISVFVSGPGLGDEVGTIGIPPVATADPGVPDTDSPPVDTQPEPVNPDPGDDDDDDDDGDDDDGDDD